MAEMTLSDLYDQAVNHHQAGRLDEARQIYQLILSQVPDHAASLHRLGVIANQTGRPGEGEDLIRRAIALQSDNVQFYIDLALSLLGQEKLDEALEIIGRATSAEPGLPGAWSVQGAVWIQKRNFEEAIRCYLRAIELMPDYFEAHANLGYAFNQLGRHEEALGAYARANSIRPNHPDIQLNLGLMLSKLGRIEQAIDAYRRGIALGSAEAWAHNNLGNLLLNAGNKTEAMEQFLKAASLQPDSPEILNNIGMAFQRMGQFRQAADAYQKAAGLSPDSILILTNVGNILLRMGRVDEAMEAYQKVIDLKPDSNLAYRNMGTAVKVSGQAEKALEYYKKAMELAPGDVGAHSNLIYTMHFMPGIDLAALLKEHQNWNEVHAAKFSATRACHMDDHPDRALRVGFVSPDFRLHPVGRFIKPLLKYLNPSKIQAVCYSDVDAPDDITREIQSYALEWRSTVSLSNDALAGQIFADRIDILVDLTMHMADNRMLLFALKPAPLQITWLAYCSTTGLGAMDYRISDPHMDPPGWWEQFYAEETLRLPKTYWCYEAPADSPEIAPPPALKAGFFTFGCLNNLCKINDGVLDVWGRILKHAAGSRLILHAPPGRSRSLMLERFAARGVDRSRIEFADKLSLKNYLAMHGWIDLALDPFPYNGGTTSCDALWMGVPVLTLAGDRPMGRAGVSLLTNLKLEDWIATDAEEYVHLAVNAAGRPDELAALRKTMRQRMLKSPLMDAVGFADDFTALLRRAWNEKART